MVSLYDIATLEGINEKGLVANALYLAESDYGKLEGKPGLTITAWTQFVLDSYASVAEAVAALRNEPFRIVSPVRKRRAARRCRLLLRCRLRRRRPPRACRAALRTLPSANTPPTRRPLPPLARRARPCPAATRRRATCRCPTPRATPPCSSTSAAASSSTTAPSTAS